MKPTKTQIEAVEYGRRVTLTGQIRGRTGPNATTVWVAVEGGGDGYIAVEIAALTAAAEVGEPTEEAAKYAARNLLRHGEEVRLATIERCAQWIMGYSDLTISQKLNIATDLRAMKEEK